MIVLDLPTTGSSVARLDRDGRLVDADPVLFALNERAGGARGERLASPALATAVRLALRLGVVVSRSITVADTGADVRMWVRAVPKADGVDLSASDWRVVTTWRPEGVDGLSADTPSLDGDWHWDTDASLRLVRITPAAGGLHGFDAAALLGKPLTVLFDLDGRGDRLLPILSALAERTSFADQPAHLRDSGLPVMLSGAIRTDGAGAFAGFRGAVRVADDGGGKPLAAGFTARLDQALRAPLARIVANADTIRAQAEGPIAPDYAGYAADIANAGRHLLALVEDLVDLDAIERPDFALATMPIDMADVMRRAAGLLSLRARKAQVWIDGFDREVQTKALGDFRRAVQIMVNLVGNAVRYSPPGAHVTLSIVREGGRVRATVADRGSGIALADQARIFDKFERLGVSERGVEQGGVEQAGTGLGLYIARRLARAMGGDLSVESAPGEGARFTLDLPVAD